MTTMAIEAQVAIELEGERSASMGAAMTRPTLLAAIALLATTVPAPAADATGPPKPNIVFILADDLGWADTAPYGSTFHDTPNLARLAARGVRFTNAYAANPLCSPTRCSIMTGLYPG